MDVVKTLRRCWSSLVEYGDLGDCRVVRTSNPCGAELQRYVECMEAHEGARPDPYETEFCASDVQAYKLCREEAAGES